MERLIILLAVGILSDNEFESSWIKIWGCCTKKISVAALLCLKSKFQTSKSPEFGVKCIYATK